MPRWNFRGSIWFDVTTEPKSPEWGAEMRELYRMRARQCRASAAMTQDPAERTKLELIAWEWDQLAAQEGDDPAEGNVISFEQFVEARERRARRARRRAGAAAL